MAEVFHNADIKTLHVSQVSALKKIDLTDEFKISSKCLCSAIIFLRPSSSSSQSVFLSLSLTFLFNWSLC